MTSENWKPILGFEEFYEASNLGRIRSLPRKAMANYGLRTYGGKILQPTTRKSDGYLVVGLSAHGKQLQKMVHQLVMGAFGGKPPEGHECCHRNGVKSDCRFDNLKWGTKKENANDKHLHGTTIKGELSPNSKLTESQVIEIRSMQGTNVAIAKHYGVTDVLIGKIKRRESWAHI